MPQNMLNNDARIMTTRELADYIKLNEKTIIKMAQDGRLPGIKIGSQWRFHTESIDAYFRNGAGKGERSGVVLQPAMNIMPLSRLIRKDLIALDVLAKERDDALRALSEIIAQKTMMSQKKTLFNELKEREKMLSTAIGNGFAIPHPRHPSEELFQEPAIVFLRLKHAIDYEAPDDRPVRIFLMVCAPDESIHLRLLARISKLLHFPNIYEQCVSAQSKEDIFRILLRFDRAYMFSLPDQGE